MLKPNDLRITTSIIAVVFFAVFMVTGPSAYNFQSVLAHYGVKLDKCEDDDDYYHDNKKDCDRNFNKHDQEDDYCDDKEHDHTGHDNGDEWCDDHGEGNGNDNCDDNGKDQDHNNDNHNDDDCNDNGHDHDNDNGHDDRHDKNGNNQATQSINQAQSSSQISQCISGGNTAASCNNINLQNQENSGNNALAQR
ncbi:MAG TPA: hypothetical protein VFV86_10820 [Nitrososphaeraceae archaeon]|nr:hypothetical protein [Nitrososphaeraceae archaeon]